MEISEEVAVQLVRSFKELYPEAYARWFLLEAIHLGIDDVGSELNDFVWTRLGKSSDALISGIMAMRGVIYREATDFLTSVLVEVAEYQWRDVKRLMEEIAGERAQRSEFRS